MKKTNFTSNNSKKTSKLVRAVAGIALTAASILPLSGCYEYSYSYHRTYTPQRRIIMPAPSRHIRRYSPCVPQKFRQRGTIQNYYYHKYHPSKYRRHR